MIYVLYLVVAALVTFMSIKASEYVDMLDKTTSLSGAFLGGILLSAVTSLPELFTSISSTLMLDQPGLCIGNILGSNLFNYAMLSVFILTAVVKFAKCDLSKIHFVRIPRFQYRKRKHHFRAHHPSLCAHRLGNV